VGLSEKDRSQLSYWELACRRVLLKASQSRSDRQQVTTKLESVGSDQNLDKRASSVVSLDDKRRSILAGGKALEKSDGE
jgi:hypothetical protein